MATETPDEEDESMVAEEEEEDEEDGGREKGRSNESGSRQKPSAESDDKSKESREGVDGSDGGGSDGGGSDGGGSDGGGSDDDDGNPIENGTGEGNSKVKRSSKPTKKKYGLIFAHSRATRTLKNNCGVIVSNTPTGGKTFKRFNVGPKSGVALAAVVEEICKILLQGAVNETDRKNRTITPKHVKLAITHDPDLKFLISGGGGEMVIGGTGTGVDPSVFTGKLKRNRDLEEECKKIEKRGREDMKEKRERAQKDVSNRHAKLISVDQKKKRF